MSDHPVHGDARFALRGYSGAVLAVRTDERGTYVEKRATSAEGNRRLRDEATKLAWLGAVGQRCGLFTAPEVYETGVDTDGNAYYEMAFVPSWQLDHLLPRLAPAEIETRAREVHDIVLALAGESPPGADEAGPSDTTAFLLGKLTDSATAIEDRQLPRAIVPLGEEFRAAAAAVGASTIPLSVSSGCHGDLALDNVLVAKTGRLTLVDPLRNDVEASFWDAAKVLQSSLAGWSEIKEGKFTLDLARGRIHMRVPEQMTIFNAAFVECLSRTLDPDAVMLYLAVTLARVLRYTRDDDQLAALLLLATDSLKRYLKGANDLDEPPGPLRW